MRRVEEIRLRDGLTKKEVAAEPGTTSDVVGEWIRGQTLGRAESVQKIRDFLKSRETARTSGVVPR
jgi:transcriptional regulator with XRE-family HTH domain